MEYTLKTNHEDYFKLKRWLSNQKFDFDLKTDNKIDTLYVAEEGTQETEEYLINNNINYMKL